MTDAKKPDEWMPLLVDKYLGDTTHLTTEQHGAYLLLLLTGWKRGGVLPPDDLQLSQIARMTPAKWRASRSVLLPFFHQGPDGLTQKRLSIEVERAQHLIAVRTDAGQKGARGRWQTDGKRNGKPDGKPDGKTMAKGMATDMANTMANGMANRWQKGDTGGSPIPSPSSTPTPSVNPLPPTEESSRFLPRERASTQAGEACKAIREAGIGEVSPSNVKLLALLEQGATVDELRCAAVKAVEHGKGFGYMLGIVKGDREDAARVSLVPKKPSPFALPPGHVRVLPADLPDLEMNDEARHVDDAEARR